MNERTLSDAMPGGLVIWCEWPVKGSCGPEPVDEAGPRAREEGLVVDGTAGVPDRDGGVPVHAVQGVAVAVNGLGDGLLVRQQRERAEPGRPADMTPRRPSAPVRNLPRPAVPGIVEVRITPPRAGL